MRFVCGRCRAGRIATRVRPIEIGAMSSSARSRASSALVRSTLPARSSRQAPSVADRAARRGGIGCRRCLTPLMWKRTPSEPVGAAAWRRFQNSRPASWSVSSNSVAIGPPSEKPETAAFVNEAAVWTCAPAARPRRASRVRA
jgi:hypothetical protein